MAISNEDLKSLLIESGKLTEDVIKNAWPEGAKTPLREAVIGNNLLSEKELTAIIAKKLDVPLADLENLKVPREILNKIPERTARKYQAVLFALSENDEYELAMADPEDFQAVDFLAKQLGTRPIVYMATPTEIGAIADQYKGGLSGEIADTVKDSEDGEADGDSPTGDVDTKDLGEDSAIARTVNVVLEYAAKSHASDIHIEPRDNVIQVRYRIDGILHETMTLPKNIISGVVSRIKILANLKIDEHRIPQDGRFKITMSDHTMSIRVSTLPVMDGEKVVMRLLDESTKAPTFEELGVYGQSLEAVGDSLHRTHGMTLVTGPTGSGKSTTLYALLTIINTPGINISTVEDPVEYRVKGVNQTQVNTKTGMTFANGLRALLRQDPNVIMVGEIRDSETADLAVQAALTGHVVLSTLHTNNAATTLPRLLDMNIEPFLIASTVNTVIAQRLVRELCVKCRIGYIPEADKIDTMVKEFNLGPALTYYKEAQHKHNLLIAEDAEDKKKPKLKPGQLWIYKPGPGCQACGKVGYKGRVGIFEVFNVTPTIQRLIISRAASNEIQNQAIKEGMLTMQQDGFIKVLMGVTNIEEVLRVTRE